jgi:FtsP/CotA-like multicopper oxidase with cupredoxin domain
MRDVINVPTATVDVNDPYNPAKMVPHRVKLLMDFRDSNTKGEFVCHCHILEHEDGGMMGKILVNY